MKPNMKSVSNPPSIEKMGLKVPKPHTGPVPGKSRAEVAGSANLDKAKFSSSAMSPNKFKAK